MEDDMKKLLGVMLVIIVGLAVTVVVAEQSELAQYGNVWNGEAVTVVPATSNVTTLTHGWIYNNTAYISCVLNDTTIEPTGTENYTVSYIGTYAVGANITWAGLTSGSTYVGTVSYRTRLATAAFTLLGLAPLFWVIFIMGAAVVVVWKKLSPKSGQV